jgi:hypothetical protein
MGGITVDVWLYGPLVRYGGKAEKTNKTDGKSYANLKVDLPDGSMLHDLLQLLSLPTEERGITFINGTLTAFPGVQSDLSNALQNGDRVALFHLNSMWPFQYRHGAAIDTKLSDAIDDAGGLSHNPSQ